MFYIENMKLQAQFIIIFLIEPAFARFSNDNQRKFEVISRGVSEIVREVIAKHENTANLASADSSDSNYFKSILIKNILKDQVIAIRQTGDPCTSNQSPPRKRSLVVIIEKVAQFESIVKNLSSNCYRFSGLYLIVLLNQDKENNIESIFEMMWRIQIFNVNVVSWVGDRLEVRSFMPFSRISCHDTSPVLINEYRNGNFLNGTLNFFPEKMNNLHGCLVRMAIASNSEPYIMIQQEPNGSLQLYGREKRFLDVLEESLNFRLSFTYIGEETYDHMSTGPLRAVLDRHADMSANNWWLKSSRLKFLDATTTYTNDHIVLLVPPGKALTAFEKLLYPFSSGVWMMILMCFAMGLVIIVPILRFGSGNVKSLVFESKIKYPILNMFSAFIGSPQNALPVKSCARLLLMTFMMYSIVMRTLYQGSYYKFMKESIRHKEIQSLDEIVQKNFKLYVMPGIGDMFNDLRAIKER